MIRYLKDNSVPAFDPDTIQILCGALDIAWQTIEIDTAALKVDGNAARTREVLAKQIWRNWVSATRSALPTVL
jgi:hypothetical protein